MTLIKREDAIDTVEELNAKINDDRYETICTLDVLRRIKALPSAELTLQTPQTYGKSINLSNAEVVEDYISRADAIEAIDDAIDADSPQWAILKTKIGFLPSAELPKGELISRTDAIERIVNDNVVGGMDRVNEYRNSNEHNDYLDGISCAIATVDDVPSAETHEIRTETHGVCSDLISRKKAKEEIYLLGWNPSISVIWDCLDALPSDETVHIHNDGTLEVKVPNAHKVGRVLVMDTDSHISGGLFYPDDAEAVEGCDGCRYDTRIPQKQCLRCSRYWRDSYERKGGEEE